MTMHLRIFLGIGVIAYYVLILYFIKRKMLALKYTLMWLFSGIMLGILVVCPKILEVFVDFIGISLPVNGLFLVVLFMGMIITISLTSIVSKQAEKIKNLTQEISILGKEIRDMKRE